MQLEFADIYTGSADTGAGAGVRAGICLGLEPEPEISKMDSSGNPDYGNLIFK